MYFYLIQESKNVNKYIDKRTKIIAILIFK